MRLDKWLWCARFFKTRALAAAAVKSGKVLVAGNRPRPAKTIQPGDRLSIRRGPYEYRLEITGLTAARLGATAAQALYLEDKDSIATREQLAARLKAEAQSQPRTHGRPTKRERRQLVKLKSEM